MKLQGIWCGIGDCTPISQPGDLGSILPGGNIIQWTGFLLYLLIFEPNFVKRHFEIQFFKKIE